MFRRTGFIFQMLLTRFEDRDPSLARFLSQERERIKNPESLCQAYPSLRLVRKTFQRLDKVQGFLKSHQNITTSP